MSIDSGLPISFNGSDGPLLRSSISEEVCLDQDYLPKDHQQLCVRLDVPRRLGWKIDVVALAYQYHTMATCCSTLAHDRYP
jgi:hypothetical protein